LLDLDSEKNSVRPKKADNHDIAISNRQDLIATLSE